MRVLLGATLAFVAACATIVGLDDPGEAPPTGGDAALPDSPAPGPDGSGVPDATPIIDASDANADAPPPRPATCDENGLVGRWMFDEGFGLTAYDCTSGKHDGVITGTEWVTGKVGPGALRFTGDSVDVGNPEAFKITGAITVTAWINPTAGTTASGRIVSKSSQSDRGWELNLEGGTSLEFKIGTGTTSYTQVSTPITTGAWHHAAGVYSPSADVIRVYVDGQASTITGVASSQRDAPFNVLVGAHPGETCCKFPGVIDDVRIYSRALSGTEIQAIMSAAQ